MRSWITSFWSTPEDNDRVFQRQSTDDFMDTYQSALITYQPPPQPATTSLTSFLPDLSSIWSKPRREPQYIRITEFSMTPEQEALMVRIDEQLATHRARAEDANATESSRTISTNKIKILDQCAFLISEPTWGSQEALRNELENQKDLPNNYRTNDGKTAYIGWRSTTEILVNDVLAWLKKQPTLKSNLDEFEIDSPIMHRI